MSKATKPISQKNYRDNKGSRCPNCKTFHPKMRIVSDVEPTVAATGALVRVTCCECNAVWTAVMRPHRYDGLKCSEEALK